MMITYWDLTEEERGTLTEDEVERYLDAELMTKGVLRARPLELVTVPELPPPTRSYYAARTERRYGRAEFAFESKEEAERFLALRPLVVDSEYLGSSGSVEYVREAETEIVAVALYTEGEKDAHKRDIEKAGAAKAENERRTREHTEAVKKQTEALKGLWEDWHACREKVRRLNEIRATFEEYKKIAGDDGVAATFLGKVYTPTEIAEALPSPTGAE